MDHRQNPAPTGFESAVQFLQDRQRIGHTFQHLRIDDGIITVRRFWDVVQKTLEIVLLSVKAAWHIARLVMLTVKDFCVRSPARARVPHSRA